MESSTTTTETHSLLKHADSLYNKKDFKEALLEY
jgi:hypothetical protein